MVNQLKILKKLINVKNHNPTKQKNLNYKIFFLKEDLKRTIFSRYLVISKSLLKCSVYVHKGNIFRKLFLNKYLLGKKLGEFSITRKPFKYPIKKKKKNFLRR